MTAADAAPLPSPTPSSAPSSVEPDRGYVICSEHRSGSTLLCHWLRSTEVLGHPREYFSITEDAIAIERDPARLDGVLRAAATANGVYGIKLFSQQFDNTVKAAWLPRLPGARFVHLERRDLLGQAISMVRALQTEQYEAGQAATAAPRYDRRAIARQLRRLAEAHARWRRWFARNGIAVLWLVYEDMVGDPDATVAAVARHVGLPAPAPIDPAAVRVAVQRDAVSAEWRARFLAEAGDLNHLDHPLGKPRVWARRLARDVGQMVRVARRRLTGG